MEKNPEELAWIHATRTVNTNLGVFTIRPSPRRVQDRIAIAEAIMKKGKSVEKVDTIINYFRRKYEGHTYSGLTKPERARLFAMRGGICWICEKPMRLKDATVDHRRPRLLGGTSDWGNLEIAHYLCNQKRGDGITDRMGFLREELGGTINEAVDYIEPESPHAI